MSNKKDDIDAIIENLINNPQCGCGVKLEKKQTYNEDGTEMYIETICPVCGVVKDKLTCNREFNDNAIDKAFDSLDIIMANGEGDTAEGLVNGLRKRKVPEKMILDIFSEMLGIAID